MEEKSSYKILEELYKNAEPDDSFEKTNRRVRLELDIEEGCWTYQHLTDLGYTQEEIEEARSNYAKK